MHPYSNRGKTVLVVSMHLCIVGSLLAQEAYFPVQTKPNESGITAFEAKWYGGCLERMKEPRLTEAAGNSDSIIYRMMVLPTWGNPIAVRAEKHGSNWTLASRRLGGQGGYDPGKLVESKDIQLSEEDSKALEMLVAQLKLFQMSTEDNVSGFDGDEWILEGVSGGKYHVIDRWCASSEKTQERGLEAFMRLCKFLIDKSCLSVRPENKGHKLI